MYPNQYEKVRSRSASSSSRESSPTARASVRWNLGSGTRSCSRPFFLGFLVALPTLIIVLVFGGVIVSRTWKPTLRQITISARIAPDFCGSTPAEAKAAGCKFEINNFAWLHPSCYDEELDRDWTAGPLSGDLEFWEEYGGKGLISRDRVMKGEIEKVWVNTQQHRRHCLFVWEKYQRAAMDMRPMDNWTVDYKHTQHCISLLRDPSHTYADDAVTSFLTLKYPSCEYGPVQLAITSWET
ncbi:hypothetical protein PWT90_05582 [Aphanocladium album]|nr:hypothetical protein PWT90_05582 [Aphanocladium album]